MVAVGEAVTPAASLQGSLCCLAPSPHSVRQGQANLEAKALGACCSPGQGSGGSIRQTALVPSCPRVQPPDGPHPRGPRRWRGPAFPVHSPPELCCFYGNSGSCRQRCWLLSELIAWAILAPGGGTLLTERCYRTACVWSAPAPWARASLSPRRRARVATPPRPQRGPPEVPLHPPSPFLQLS